MCDVPGPCVWRQGVELQFGQWEPEKVSEFDRRRTNRRQDSVCKGQRRTEMKIAGTKIVWERGGGGAGGGRGGEGGGGEECLKKERSHGQAAASAWGR